MDPSLPSQCRWPTYALSLAYALGDREDLRPVMRRNNKDVLRIAVKASRRASYDVGSAFEWIPESEG